VLVKIKRQELVGLIQQNSYKQSIKSTSKMSETSIITHDALMQLLAVHSDAKLDELSVQELSQCVCLTPKFSNLYHTKILIALVSEIDEQLAAAGKAGLNMQAQVSFSTKA
jgi:DNA integrity scanning protein DisA with diadenylate cyclase activity